MSPLTQVAEEKCENCGIFQGFTISKLNKIMDYVQQAGNKVYFEGWWNCEGCGNRNSAQSEVSF
jgi:hypothetical protein